MKHPAIIQTQTALTVKSLAVKVVAAHIITLTFKHMVIPTELNLQRGFKFKLNGDVPYLCACVYVMS